MAEIAKYAIDDLGGGLNEGLPATHLADKEMAELYNFIPFGSKLIRRRGVSKLTSTAHSENLTSAFAYKDTTGVVTIVCGALTGMARLSGTGMVSLTNSDGGLLASSDIPWDMFQYKSVGYALRPDVGLRRFGSDFFQQAGIAALTAAPTLVDAGAAGAMEAGDYYYVVTRYNTVTGAESNPSPTSAKITQLINHKVAVTWADASTGQWNAYRIYRTLPNQAPEAFYFVDQVGAFTYAYTDALALANLGGPVSNDNDLPPVGVGIGSLFRERAFASNGIDVFFSEEGMPESWAADNVVRVFREDKHEIRSLTAFGDRLLVGKTNAMHFLTPAGVRKFGLQTLSDRHGSYSHWAVQTAEGIAIWYSGTDFIRSDGTNVTAIATTKIKNLLARIPDNRKKYITAGIDAPNSLYFVTIPLDSSTHNRVVLAYNYKTDAWTVLDHWNTQLGMLDAPSFFTTGIDANYGLKFYSTFYDGHLYQYFTGTNDFGNVIRARFRTKEFNRRGFFAALRRVYLLCQSLSQTVTLSLYRDGGALASKTRTVSLAQGVDWKIYALNTLGTPSSTLQLGLEYTGSDALELEGMALEVLHLPRTARVA